MIGKLKTKRGQVNIKNEVLAKVAGVTAMECYGIVGMAMVNMTSGITKLMMGDNITKGISLTVKNNKIDIDLHIVVEYGVNIKAVTENIISNVSYKLESFSGLEVSSVNIFVEDVRVDEIAGGK